MAKPRKSTLKLTRSREFLHLSVNGVGGTAMAAGEARQLAEAFTSTLPNREFEFHVVDGHMKKEGAKGLLSPDEIRERVSACDAGVHGMGLGAASSGVKNKFFEYDLFADLQCAIPSADQHGERWALLSVAREMYPTANAGVELGHRMCGVLARCREHFGAYHGVIDAGTFAETLSGGYFHGWLNARSRSLSRQIEKVLWDELGVERRKRVRGVYWAMLLSGPVLASLGGEDFIAELRTECRSCGLSPTDTFDPCVRVDAEAIIVRLCPNPWDVILGVEMDPHPLAVHLGAVIRRKLVQRQLLL